MTKNLCIKKTLKGSVSRDFLSLLFSWFEPIWAIDKQTEVFSYYFFTSPKHSNFYETPRGASHCGVNPHGVHHTAESSVPNFEEKKSPVCTTPPSQSPRCASYCRNNIRGVHHTVESNCTPGVKIELLSLVAFKGTIRTNPSISEHIYHERKDLKYIKCWF